MYFYLIFMLILFFISLNELLIFDLKNNLIYNKNKAFGEYNIYIFLYLLMFCGYYCFYNCYICLK